MQNWFWQGCKPNSVCALASGENHLSQRPIPETCFAFTKRGTSRSSVSYLALHPMGFSVPRCLRFARCAVTGLFHPSPRWVFTARVACPPRGAFFPHFFTLAPVPKAGGGGG